MELSAQQLGAVDNFDLDVALDDPLPKLTSVIARAGDRALVVALSHATLAPGGSLPTNVASVLVDDAVRAAFDLSGYRARAPLGSEGYPSPYCRDDALLGRFRARLESQLEVLGLPDDGTLSPTTCLKSVLRFDNTLHTTASVTVRPYDIDLLNVVRDGHVTVPLESLLDGVALQLALEPVRYILLPDDEVDEDALAKVAIYTDPALQDQATMRQFLERMVAAGLVVFGRSR